MSVTGNQTPRHGDPYNYPIVPDQPIIANPAPLGLAAFGITTFVLSMYNAGLGYGYNEKQNVVVGLALFYGGLAQLLAGMWEFKAGNTFGATAFTSYGAFWLSFATILIPGSGVIAGYEDVVNTQAPSGAPLSLNTPELDDAVGIFLLGWALFTFILFLCTFRQNVASILLFGMLTITFLLLAIGKFSKLNGKTATQAGGYTGIFTALNALYIALANLANKEHTFFTLPIGRIGIIEEDVLKTRKMEDI